jgi:hypothetical protein
MFNKNGKIWMIKNNAANKFRYTTVVTYYVVSYNRYLNTDPGSK